MNIQMRESCRNIIQKSSWYKRGYRNIFSGCMLDVFFFLFSFSTFKNTTRKFWQNPLSMILGVCDAHLKKYCKICVLSSMLYFLPSFPIVSPLFQFCITFFQTSTRSGRRLYNCWRRRKSPLLWDRHWIVLYLEFVIIMMVFGGYLLISILLLILWFERCMCFSRLKHNRIHLDKRTNISIYFTLNSFSLTADYNTFS